MQANKGMEESDGGKEVSMFEKLFNATFEGEEEIACEKARINWPNRYRLIIKAKVLKYKPCKKCGHSLPAKKTWGYLIDKSWVHWSEFKGWKKIGTKEQAKKAGLEEFASLIGRKLEARHD